MKLRPLTASYAMVAKSGAPSSNRRALVPATKSIEPSGLTAASEAKDSALVVDREATQSWDPGSPGRATFSGTSDAMMAIKEMAASMIPEAKGPMAHSITRGYRARNRRRRAPILLGRREISAST